jgi:hypothetical protein
MMKLPPPVTGATNSGGIKVDESETAVPFGAEYVGMPSVLNNVLGVALGAKLVVNTR